MEKYIDAFLKGFNGTLNWTYKSILFEVPWYTNYFYGVILLSLVVWILEIVFPWRKNQGIFRKDFWLDTFYIFFNFFIFAIAIGGVYKVLETLFLSIGVSMNSLAIVNTESWHVWLQLFVFFIVLDFVQWFTHILLHRYEFLWRFHQIHHSVGSSNMNMGSIFSFWDGLIGTRVYSGERRRLEFGLGQNGQETLAGEAAVGGCFGRETLNRAI